MNFISIFLKKHLSLSQMHREQTWAGEVNSWAVPAAWTTWCSLLTPPPWTGAEVGAWKLLCLRGFLGWGVGGLGGGVWKHPPGMTMPSSCVHGHLLEVHRGAGGRPESFLRQF